MSALHTQTFNREGIVRLIDGMPVNGEVSDRDDDVSLLRHDEVAELVSDYGTLGSTIESLAHQCALLYSEDMQHGQRIEGMRTIRNPFL